jgi:hypothetical protein
METRQASPLHSGQQLQSAHLMDQEYSSVSWSSPNSDFSGVGYPSSPVDKTVNNFCGEPRQPKQPSRNGEGTPEQLGPRAAPARCSCRWPGSKGHHRIRAGSRPYIGGRLATNHARYAPAWAVGSWLQQSAMLRPVAGLCWCRFWWTGGHRRRLDTADGWAPQAPLSGISLLDARVAATEVKPRAGPLHSRHAVYPRLSGPILEAKRRLGRTARWLVVRRSLA